MPGISVRGVVDGSRYGGRRGNYAVLSGIESVVDNRAIPRDELRGALANVEGGVKAGEAALQAKLVRSLLCVRAFDQGRWDPEQNEYVDDHAFGTPAGVPTKEQVDTWLRRARLKHVDGKFVPCGDDEGPGVCTEPVTREDLLADPYTRSGFKGVSSRTWLPRRRPPVNEEEMDGEEVDEERLRRAHGKDSTRARRWIGYYTRFRDREPETKAMRMNRALLGMFHHKFFAALAHALADKVYHRHCLRDGEGKENACDSIVHAGFAIKRLVEMMDRCHLERAKGARSDCESFNLSDGTYEAKSKECDGYVSVDPNGLDAALRDEDGEAATGAEGEAATDGDHAARSDAEATTDADDATSASSDDALPSPNTPASVAGARIEDFPSTPPSPGAGTATSDVAAAANDEVEGVLNTFGQEQADDGGIPLDQSFY